MYHPVVCLLDRLETCDARKVQAADHLPGFGVDIASFAALLAAALQEEAQAVQRIPCPVAFEEDCRAHQPLAVQFIGAAECDAAVVRRHGVADHVAAPEREAFAVFRSECEFLRADIKLPRKPLHDIRHRLRVIVAVQCLEEQRVEFGPWWIGL